MAWILTRLTSVQPCLVVLGLVLNLVGSMASSMLHLNHTASSKHSDTSTNIQTSGCHAA